MPWVVDFYIDAKGQAPVEEFLSLLAPDRRGGILQYIEMLKEHGPTLPYPYSSQIEGRLRELRCHFGSEQYRILYYGDPHRQFILLHALRKKSEKLPDRDRQLALRRLADDVKSKSRKERENR